MKTAFSPAPDERISKQAAAGPLTVGTLGIGELEVDKLTIRNPTS